MKTQKTIRNCEEAFRFLCPKNWEELIPTDDAAQRQCDQCQQIVYLCVTDEETLQHAQAGHCIARELPDESELPRMLLGFIGDPEEIPEEPESVVEARRWRSREAGIDDSLANIEAERQCPKCHFPAPDWRETCRVCGYEFGHVRRPKDS